jgi:hypothetical protein
MELEKGKTADRKGTAKAVWQKTGMALKKKIQKKNTENMNIRQRNRYFNFLIFYFYLEMIGCFISVYGILHE